MKRLWIVYENYKEFIDENLYYVDKTLLNRELLNASGKVNLFTRPRRFGKTLTLSRNYEPGTFNVSYALKDKK